jgi:histidinol-phosphate phosphatase family protein
MILMDDNNLKNWTLFLDRDGVINQRISDGYVLSPEMFLLLPGVLDAIALFSRLFGKIIIVTNQQGIGKGLMTEKDLNDVHTLMSSEIIAAGGRIDGIYFCPQLAQTPNSCRKPEIAMGLMARADHPEIRFRRGVMVGDAPSDMLFAKRLGVKQVFVDQGDAFVSAGEAGYHLRVNALTDFAKWLSEGNHPADLVVLNNSNTL